MKWFKNIFKPIFTEKTTKSFLQKWADVVLASTKDHLGKESATRLNGYIMATMITIMVLVSCAVEIGNMCLSLTNGEIYAIGYGFIAIFGMVLSHQLVLFNLKKSNESSSFPTLEKMNDEKNKSLIPKPKPKDPDHKPGIVPDLKNKYDDL